MKIYFPTPAHDPFTGLDQPVAGCVSLNGVEALAYARSRHYAIPRHGVQRTPTAKLTSDWSEDPLADLDRIQRQQYFLRSLGQTALEHGASNPLTALHLADAVASSLTGDKTLTNSDLKIARADLPRPRSRDGRDDDAAGHGGYPQAARSSVAVSRRPGRSSNACET